MRKLITILLILFAVQGFGQVYQQNNSFGWQYKRLKIDSTLHIPTFCGVPTLRSSVVGNQAAIAMDSCNNMLYFYNPKDSSWNIVGSGGVIIGGDGVDSVTYSSNELCQWVDGVSTCYRLNKFFDSTSYNEGKIYYYNNGTLRDSTDISGKDTVDVGNGLGVTWENDRQKIFAIHPDGYEGGIVTYSGTGFDFNVSPITLYLRNEVFLFPETTLTLSAPNSLPRYDIFGVDSLGAFVKSGDSAALPIEPQVGIDSFALTKAFLISPGDTAPSNIGTVIIYDEHTINEYTAGYEGAASTIDFDNTDNPKHISKATYISSYHNGAQWYFYDPTYTRITPQSDQVITGWVYLNDSTTNNFAVFLADSNLTTTNHLYLSDYGIDRNNPNVYQQFSIPVNNFYFHGTRKYTTIEFQAIGSDTSGAGGLYMDYINLQSGVQNTLQLTDYSNKQDSSTVVKTTIGSDTANVINDWVKGIAYPRKDTIWTGGSGGGAVLSVTGNPSGLVDNADPENPVIQQDDLKLNISDTASMLSPYLRKNALAAGTDISLAGTGTDADPIVISASGDGSGVDSTAYHTSEIIGDSLLVLCDLKGRCDTIAMSSISPWGTNGNTVYVQGVKRVSIGVDTSSGKAEVRSNIAEVSNLADSNAVVLSNADSSTTTIKPSVPIILSSYGFKSGVAYKSYIRMRSESVASSSFSKPNFYIEGSSDGITYTKLFTATSAGGIIANGGSSTFAGVAVSFLSAVSQISAGYIDVAANGYVHSPNIGATTRLDVGTITPDYSAIQNNVSTNQGLLTPRMTSSQRDSINLVVTGATITNGGSYTGTPTVAFSNTNRFVLATGTAVKTGSAVTSITITNGGNYYNTPTITFSGGSGSGATATAIVTQQLTTGLTIFCTDCTATDSSTGVMQTWNGTSWKNNW